MEAVVVKGKNYAFVLIASEEYWKRLRQRSVESGGALAFVRKGQVGPIRAKKIIFYIKKPAMQIRGFADFIERLKGDSDEMWARYGKESCFKTEEEYCSFIQGRDKATFVRLENLTELNQPKTGEEISLALGSLRGFRGKYVDQETTVTLIT